MRERITADYRQNISIGVENWGQKTLSGEGCQRMGEIREERVNLRKNTRRRHTDTYYHETQLQEITGGESRTHVK